MASETNQEATVQYTLFLSILCFALTLAVPDVAICSEAIPSDAEIIAAQDNSTLLEVNGEAVPRWMFDNALRDVLRKDDASSEESGSSSLAQHQRDVLDNLVAMKLLEQQARRQGLTVELSGGALRATIIRNGYKKQEDFRQALAKAGMTEQQYSEIWSQQASVNRLVAEKIVASVDVAEDQVLARYELDKEKYPGASFQDVSEQLHTILLEEKRRAAFDSYLAKLIDAADVRVADPHLKAIYERR